MAEAKSNFPTQDQSATKDSTLSSLRECDKQIIAFRLLLRNKMRELNQFEQHVRKLDENKATLLVLQPQLQENILQMAKTISTSDTDCLRIKNKLPYLSRRAISDNISRLELQLRTHNYRPREEELVLKEISKLRNSLPLVEVYRERLQGNRALRNNKMRLVNQRNLNFERLQKMHATLVAETDRLNQSKISMEESEKGLEDLLKRKDALIEVAKEKLKKRQKRRQQKKIQEQSRPPDSGAAVTVLPWALKRFVPPVERNAFSLELAACRVLLRYARSLAGTWYGGTSAPAGTAAEDLITCNAASTNSRAVFCTAERNTTVMGRDTAASPACVSDEVASDSKRDAEDLDRTRVHALVSSRSEEKIALTESVSMNGDKGGKFYCKHEDQERCFVHVKPKNRSHKERKAKKTIGHPPEIVVNFIELGIPVPKTLGDVQAAISNIQHKLNYFELLSEQVYFEKVMSQREINDSVSSDDNSCFSCNTSKSTMRTQQESTINTPDQDSLALSSLGGLTDASYNEQLDLRERNGLDFPTMAGSKSVLDGNSHVCFLDSFCPVADLDCEDSLQLSLLSPLQAEMKSYCEATKCSLEPVLSLPHLALFNLPDDQITNSPQNVLCSGTHSSFEMSDIFLITAPGSLERPQLVSPVVASPSVSCPDTSTSAALSVSAAAHQSTPTTAVSIASTSSVAVSSKCLVSTTTSGSVNRVRDVLRAGPWLNLATEKLVSEDNLSVSYAADESLTDGNANIHRNSDGDVMGTCCTNVDLSASTVNDALPDERTDLTKSNSNEGKAKNGSDIHNNKNNSNFSNTICALSVHEDNAVTVITVPVKYSESEDKSEVCHDGEPSQPPVTEATLLLEDMSRSRLDVVGDGSALVSSSISIASSDSGVATVPRRQELDCDPAYSTDSAKSTSSGCSCSYSNANANDEGSDWSNSDVGGLDHCSDIILQPIIHKDGVMSTTSSLIRTVSSSSISSASFPQPTYSTSVPTSIFCSVASHSHLQIKFQNAQSCSAVSSLQNCSRNDSLDQSVVPIPTIKISESVSTGEDDRLSNIVDDKPTPGAIDQLSSSSRDFGKRETESGDVEFILRVEESQIFKNGEAIKNENSAAPFSINTCEQVATTKLQTSLTSTHSTFHHSDTPTTSLNREGLAAASISSTFQSALRRSPTSHITIGEQCPRTIPSDASSSTLQDNQPVPVFPASRSPLDTSPSAGFCALSPAHVSAALFRSRQEAALVTYADIAKSSVPQNR